MLAAREGGGAGSGFDPVRRGDGATMTPSGDELRRRIGEVPFWWHPIDLGDGIVTPGRKASAEAMAAEHAALALPDLRGKDVLDIGAWDGYHAFAAERAGASRVVALDHFVWEREERGGGRGFDLAHRTLGSTVEKVHADWEAIDPATVGTFDVVLFLGVLYHLPDPLGGLRRLLPYVKPGGRVVIETEAVELFGVGSRPVAEFFPADELAGDDTNWWAPNMAALQALCHSAGFSRVEVVKGPAPTAGLHRISRYRAIVHAIA